MNTDNPTRPANKARRTLDVGSVTIPEDRLRGVQEDIVASLAESMGRIGQRLPITVRETPGPGGGDASKRLVVVAGVHRLLAARSLGWQRIEATHFEGDETDARLWEIAENLHRAELTALECSAHFAEWMRLMAVRDAKPAQLARVSPTGGRGREGGLSAAARALGVSRREGQRALKIDALDPAAKELARELGLHRTQAALLEAAKEGDADAQIAALHRLARRKRADAQNPGTGDAGREWQADQAAVAAGEARAEPAGAEGPGQAVARLARELVSPLSEPRRRALREALADDHKRGLLIGCLCQELAERAGGGQ